MADFYAFYLIPPIRTKKQKKQMFQAVIRPKCAELLRKSGFVSYKNEDMSWYRMVGDELVQTVYFYSKDRSMPFMLDVAFGCHPLFIEPFIPHPLTNHKRSYHNPSERIENAYRTFSLKLRLEMISNPLMLSAPNDGEAEILEKYILPLLDELRTEEMVYRRIKDLALKSCTMFGGDVCVDNLKGGSFHLAEEAVYMGDEEMYPLCKDLALKQLELDVYDAYDVRMVQYAKQILEYFETGNREKYLQFLEERKQNTRKLLKKKLNI